MPPNRKRKKSESRSARKPLHFLIAGAAVVIAVAAFLLISGSLRSSDSHESNRPPFNTPTSSDRRARQMSYEIVGSYSHDRGAFTQGLLWHNGNLYESTGQYGESRLRRLEFPSGVVLKQIQLAPNYFGEGLARVGERLVQLTWQSRRGFVYDLNSFELIREFSYDLEGWGLTHDGTSLIMSDGGSDLFYLDPETFKPTKKLTVKMNGQPIEDLNELEFIEGEIWANVWHTDWILRIDPSTGIVTSFIDLKGILSPSELSSSESVLNGIAYDATGKRIFVTGKLWPKLFEIRVKP